MYNELSKVKITDKRSVVISSCEKGGYTVAQKVIVEDEQRTSSVFMKGAIIVPNLDSLKSLRDALNIVIKNESDKRKYQRNKSNWG